MMASYWHDERIRQTVCEYTGKESGIEVAAWTALLQKVRDDTEQTVRGWPATPDTWDGYHTFSELYEHRHALFVALLSMWPERAFKTRRDQDGVETNGWFIAGLETPIGQITYHLPDEWWKPLSWVRTLERNKGYDGHTSQDVVDRLRALPRLRKLMMAEDGAVVDDETAKRLEADLSAKALAYASKGQ